jgi:hypothetical protein
LITKIEIAMRCDGLRPAGGDRKFLWVKALTQNCCIAIEFSGVQPIKLFTLFGDKDSIQTFFIKASTFG